MKKTFEPAVIEIVLCTADVVRTSGFDIGEGDHGDADIFGITIGGGSL